MKKLGATGILYQEGRILLGRRVDTDAHFPGIFCTPGGGVESGETVDEACEREFLEEVGLKVRCIDFTCVAESPRTLLVFRQVLSRDAYLEYQALDGFSDVLFFTWGDIEILNQENKITPLTYQGLIAFKRYLRFHNV